MRLDTEDGMKQVWEAGSYSEFAPQYLPMAGRLVEAAAVEPGTRVLDVGCGTGNVAVTAARRGADVSGLDIAPAMLEEARRNADVAGVDGIDWREGSATDLPYGENTFDVVLSNLGHMYGDPPATTARELLRVTRPAGRIGFTSWTPTSLFPVIAGLVVTHLPPRHHPEFSEPPFMWGDRGTVEQRLDETIEELAFRTETVSYPALSPAHFWRELSEHSGMFLAFLEKVDERAELREEVVETIEPYFDASENAVELEYLLTTATVRHTE